MKIRFTKVVDNFILIKAKNKEEKSKNHPLTDSASSLLY